MDLLGWGRLMVRNLVFLEGFCVPSMLHVVDTLAKLAHPHRILRDPLPLPLAAQLYRYLGYLSGD